MRLRPAGLGAAAALVLAARSGHVQADAPAPPPSYDSPFSLATGLEYRRIHDFGVFAGVLAGSLRREKGARALYVNAEMLLGDTEYQLAFFEPRLGLSAEFTKGRFRFGVGGDLGLIGVGRATAQPAATAGFVGAYAYGTCDLTPSTADRGTPFVLVRFTVDDVVTAYPWPLPWGPSLRLGWRY